MARRVPAHIGRGGSMRRAVVACRGGGAMSYRRGEGVQRRRRPMAERAKREGRQKRKTYIRELEM